MRPKNLNTGLRGGLFEAKHGAQMGPAVWLYGWLVLRQTTEHGSTGLVLGGRPITYREIEQETGFNRRTLERWMRRLRRGGYIETVLAMAAGAGVGLVIRILKAKKFGPGQRRLPFAVPAGLQGAGVRNLARGSTQSSASMPAQAQESPAFPPRIESGNTREEMSSLPAVAGLPQPKPPKNLFPGKKEMREERVRRELQVGLGPEPGSGRIKPEALERLRRRMGQANKLDDG
jgi:hypothetical protein